MIMSIDTTNQKGAFISQLEKGAKYNVTITYSTEKGFSLMPNEILYDANLSDKAKLLFLTIQNLGRFKNVTRADLMKLTNIKSENTYYKVINELKNNNNLIIRRKNHNK